MWLDRRLACLPEFDRPAARLALLVALSSHEITDADLNAWRTESRATDAELVRLLGFGAVAAVDRLEESIVGRTPAGGG